MDAVPRCRNCHRVLRDPASRARGYGRKCWADRQPRRQPKAAGPPVRAPRSGQVDGQLELAVSAQPHPTLGCAQCGDCCDPVVMPLDFDPQQLDATPGSRAVADLAFIRQHWIRRPKQEGDADSYWNCDRFDAQTRACTAHGERPPVCRGFPWYLDGPSPERAGRLAHLRCSFLLDVPPQQRPEGARPLIPVEVIRGSVPVRDL